MSRLWWWLMYNSKNNKNCENIKGLLPIPWSRQLPPDLSHMPVTLNQRRTSPYLSPCAIHIACSDMNLFGCEMWLQCGVCLVLLYQIHLNPDAHLKDKNCMLLLQGWARVLDYTHSALVSPDSSCTVKPDTWLPAVSFWGTRRKSFWRQAASWGHN